MPDDPSPHGGEVMHIPPDRSKIPEPKPGAHDREPPQPPDMVPPAPVEEGRDSPAPVREPGSKGPAERA